MLTTQPKYSYRLTQIAGSLAVYVINHENGNIYTVTTNGHHPRCNCPSYIYRCRGTLNRCRHIAGAMTHLSQIEEQAPAPAETTAAKRARVEREAALLWG